MRSEHGVNQLDLFRQPAEPEPTKSTTDEPSVQRVYQLTELPGETFEDIFVPPEAA